VTVNILRLFGLINMFCIWCCSGASLIVRLEPTTNTVDLSGPASVVDAALSYIQSNYVDAICHDSLEVCCQGIHSALFAYLTSDQLLIPRF